MSLVSAVKDRDHDEVLQSGSDARRVVKISSSVYQTSGEPLSKEALYRAKLKYGVYQSPATNASVGVAHPKAASDIAANVANENKITINAYKRLFVDPGAAKAATKVGVKGIEHVPTVEVKKSHAGSQSAATRAYSIASSTTSAKKVTKNAVTRERSQSVSSATHVLSAKPVSTSEKVNPTPKPMNMSKVLSGAEKQAEKRIHDRTTPDRKNFSYGLKTGGAGKAAGNSFELTKDTLSKMAAKIDSATIEREADPHKYAEWAAYAVRDVDPRSLVKSEYQEREKRRQQYLSQLTSQQVLAKARENAERELKAIDALDNEKFLFGNEAYNKAAVELARKNAQKMAPYQNKINMGGGLWLSPEDVNDIAKDLINPVLGEVTQRADDQRATDLDIKERTDTYNAGYAAWLEMQHSKIRNNATIVVDTNTRHAKEKEEAKAKATSDFNELVARKDQQIAEKEEELTKTGESKEALEKEMEEKLKSKDESVALMIANFEKSNKDDLEDAHKEQEELLKPYHEALAAAEGEHAKLLDEKSSIQREIEKLHASIDSHNVLLLKYERGIKAHDEEQTKGLTNLENLDSEKQKLSSDINENAVNLANSAKERAAISAEEARLRQLEVDALVNEHQSKLKETEIELQREKLNMLDAMREAAEARGDSKIDEERVKELIGMSSEDYIAQQKKALLKEEKAPVGADLDEEDEPDEDNLATTDGDKGIKPINRHLDLGTHETEGAAPSASVRSITDVSARIPEESKSAVTGTKGKGKDAVSTAKSGDASWSEKFFLGGPKARQRRESLQKSDISEPAPSAANTKATDHTEASTSHKDGHELHHTFSGFSQDGVTEHHDTAKKATQKDKSLAIDHSEDDDDEDVPELSGTEGNDSNGANKRSSYFQEVF